VDPKDPPQHFIAMQYIDLIILAKLLASVMLQGSPYNIFKDIENLFLLLSINYHISSYTNKSKKKVWPQPKPVSESKIS
jgi:hypothetical protein